MIKISVVVITFNEERNIGRCLQSVLGVADDIVLVDSHSKDATCEIALQYGARVIKHDFEGHIQQKNWAISQARFPHVLSLDADEALDTTLQKAIAHVKANWQADGYFLNRLTNYCGTWIRHGSWYPDKKLRLWDSRKGAWGGENPHDQFLLHKESYTTQFLPGHLLHYSYYSIEQHKRQIESFSNIASQAAYKKGKRSSHFHRFLKPAFRFIKGYFLQRGFLDGKAGWLVALSSVRVTYLKYTKLQKLWREKSS